MSAACKAELRPKRQAAASLRADNENLARIVAEQAAETQCVVCYGRRRAVAFTPCGHACACEQCAGRLRDCPMCRKPITQKIRIF